MPDVTYCPPHALLQLMNAEMCSKELHPCVHAAAVAVWAISTCNYAAFCAMGAHREQEQGPRLSLGTPPVTGMQSVEKKQEEEKQGSWLGKVDYSASQLVHQPQGAFFFQQFLSSFVTLLLLLRPEIFKIGKETK